MKQQCDGQVSEAPFTSFVVSDPVSDNYSILLSYFTRQTGMDAQDIRRYLEIGDDFEDIF